MGLTRREMVGGGVGMLALTCASDACSRPAASLSPLAEAAREAWIYSLPLIESAAARAVVLRTAAPGVLVHLRRPTTPSTQRITTSNNDTLNSRAWIDLANGPARLTIPATGARYCSVALMDMYSNNFAVLGSRTTGPRGGVFTIVGPGAATADSAALRSPTRWMWVLVRLLTTGDDDLAAAHVVQEGFRVTAPTAGSYVPAVARTAAWPEYFTAAQALMVESPPPATDAALLERIAPLGLTRNGAFDPRGFGMGDAAMIAEGVAAAKAGLVRPDSSVSADHGWIYPKPNLGVFGQDYAYRARIALNGFAALPVNEAMYMWATDSSGDLRLDSSATWRLRLPADRLPPVDGFWSLTSYRALANGQFFLFDNPAARYSIGDRTAGLRRTADGGIDIVVARDPPGSSTANWLPAPRDEALGLVFRCYRPRPALVDGLYRLPPLERIG